MRKKIGFAIYVILSQLCVNCRADADAVILHHNSGLGDMITILTMHSATMHHYLTVNCIIFNCSTSMHCEPLCSISSSALLATDELFICTVSIYVWWLNNTVQRHISALHIHCKGSYDWLSRIGSTFDLYTCDHVYMSAVDYNAQCTNTVHYWLPRIGCILPFDAVFAGNYAVAGNYPALNSITTDSALARRDQRYICTSIRLQLLTSHILIVQRDGDNHHIYHSHDDDCDDNQ